MQLIKKRLSTLHQCNAVALGGGTTIIAIIRFTSTSILSRLLAPDAFAVSLILTSLLMTMNLISDLSLRPYIIREPKGADQDTGDVIWTLQVLRGVCLAALIWVLAPAFASLLGQPGVVDYIRAVTLVPLVLGFQSLGEPLATRAGVQRINERVLVMRTLASTTMTITLAFWLRSEWALVFGILLGSVSQIVIDRLVFPQNWRLRFRFERETFWRILNFTKYFFLASVLYLIITQIDRVVMARNFPLELLGLYGLALTISRILTTMIFSYQRNVFFPKITPAVREGRVDHTVVQAALGIAPLVFLFITGGAIGGGQMFFQIVFDERYLFGGVFLSVIAVRGIFMTIAEMATSIEIAHGNTRHTLDMNILSLLWMAVAIPVLLHQFGAVGLAAALATVEVLPAIAGAYRSYRRGLFIPRHYLLGALAVGGGILTGVVGTFLIKVAAAAFSISF
ncbi:MAG: oligosaccharide flippase family protein [Pseudomonadota bacterium]